MSAVSIRPARSPQKNLVVEGIAGVKYVPSIRNGFSHPPISSSETPELVDVKETSRETTLCLAGAHALVRLDAALS